MSVAEPAQLLAAIAARADAQMGGENFPVALRLLPRSVRDDLARVYRFARFVDDIGDEELGAELSPQASAAASPAVSPLDAGTNAQRLVLLNVVEGELSGLLAGTVTTLPPVSALRPLVERRGVPVQAFRDLVEANRRDQHVSSYGTFEDLLAYCALSAAPVGRIVLHVAGAATAANLADSDAVCAALQVLEHCQDVGEDARRGRVYLPTADLRAAGVDVAALPGHVTPQALRDVITLQVARSRQLLLAGRPLVRRLHGWARVAVAGYVAGGLATADALEAAGHDVLGRDVRPGKLRTAAWALRQLGRRQ
jgi:squalene synthase HpnC